MHVYAACQPDDKLSYLKDLQAAGKRLAIDGGGQHHGARGKKHSTNLNRIKTPTNRDKTWCRPVHKAITQIRV